LAFKPDAVGVLHNLALLLISCPDERLRDYEKAVTYAERAVRRRDHPDQWELLSLARLRAGHHVAAIEAAERALAPGGRVRADCLLVLAVSHAKLGHRDDAREWLSKAVAWMAEHPPNEEIESLRSEAEAALGQER